MEMYIWNISSGIFTLIVGVIVLTVFVKLIRRSKNSSQLFMPSDSLKESGKCDFPDCIRCRRQKEMLLRARTRLTYYSCEPTSTRRCQGYSELELLQKDIQSSYNNLNAVTYLENSLDAESPNPVVFVYKGIESKPVWSVNCFPGLNLLIENFEEIMQEFVSLFALLTEQNSKDANKEMLWKINDTPVGKWMICHLLDQGTRTVAADRCPITWKSISCIQCTMSGNLFGNVAFSVVQPGTTILPHYGPTNIRIRCHMGLKVPESCHMEVGTETLHWEEKNLLCFDETYLHSVKHLGTDSDGFRAVLIVDLWHPQLSQVQKQLIDYAFSPSLSI